MMNTIQTYNRCEEIIDKEAKHVIITSIINKRKGVKINVIKKH
jgi:hypothetical protein